MLHYFTQNKKFDTYLLIKKKDVDFLKPKSSLHLPSFAFACNQIAGYSKAQDQ